jgi:hypothetical protein
MRPSCSAARLLPARADVDDDGRMGMNRHGWTAIVLMLVFCFGISGGLPAARHH